MSRRRKRRPTRLAPARQLPRSVKRQSSARNRRNEKAQPIGWAFLVFLLAARTLTLSIGMLCVPTLFDATHSNVLNGQPHRTDDKSGAGQGSQCQSDIVV